MAYIFLSWERLLKTPFDSRAVISLLLRRLKGEKLNRRPQSFHSPLNKFRVSSSIRFTSINVEKTKQNDELITFSSPLHARAALTHACSSVAHTHSSVVEVGICSGILVSFRPEQSTTLDSQRHLGGQTGSLLQALLRRASSVPGGQRSAGTPSMQRRHTGELQCADYCWRPFVTSLLVPVCCCISTTFFSIQINRHFAHNRRWMESLLEYL